MGAITLILGLFALAQLNKLGDIADEVSGLRLPQVIITGELRRDFISSRLYAANFALAANKAQQEAARTSNNLATAFRDNAQRLES